MSAPTTKPASSSLPKGNAWSKPLSSATKAAPTGTISTTTTTTSTTPLAASTTANSSGNPAVRARFLHVLLQLVGTKVTITLDDSTVLTGLFYTATTPFPAATTPNAGKIVIKAVESKQGATVVLDWNRIVSVHIPSMRLDHTHNNNNSNSTPDGNRFTDAEIRRAAAGTRSTRTPDLVSAGAAWTSPPPSGGSAAATPLASRGGPTAGLYGSIGEWDQFKANEELFQVKAGYDETIYTTALDKANLNHEQVQKAERLAREIENTTSNNIHLAEERGQVIQGDYDEEDRYSGVLTSDGKVRHVATTAKMNYAAAASKAPPGFQAKETEKKVPEKVETKEEIKTTVAPETKAEEKVKTEEKSKEEVKKEEEPKVEEETKTEELKEETKTEPQKPETNGEAADTKEEASEPSNAEKDVSSDSNSEKKEAPKSKLNANAKEFTLNINAKSFTPGAASAFGGAPPSAAEPHMQHPVGYDPATGMPVHAAAMHPMHGGTPPYIPVGPMVQPGMMPHMAPHYPGMRYPGMEHMYPAGQPPMPGVQQPTTQQPPSSQVTSAQTSGASSPVTASEDDSSAKMAHPQPQDGETALSSEAPDAQYPPHMHPPQNMSQYMPMQYVMPPGAAYYNSQIGMHPPQRMPGYPMHQQHFGGPMYSRQMYPVPPAMMRGPPYYASPPMPYTGYYEDDPYRVGGRSAGGRGRGRGGRGRGPGGRGTPAGRVGSGTGNGSGGSSGRGSGRNTPQEEPTPAEAAEAEVKKE